MNYKSEYSIFECIVIALIINPLLYNSNSAIQRYAIYVMLILYLFLNVRSILLLNYSIKKNKKFVYALIIFFVWSLLVPIIHLTFDFTFLMNFWYSAVALLQITVIATYVIKKNKGKFALYDFCKLYASGIAIYVIGTIIIIILPEFREFMVKYFVVSDNERVMLQWDAYYTRIGWSGMATYGAALKCCVGLACTLFLIDKKDEYKTNNTILIVIACLMVLGNFFYARTGIIACICLIALYYVRLMMKKNRIKQLLLVTFLLICALSFIQYVMEQYSDNSAVIWIFEAINSLFNGQELTTVGSVDVMMSGMLFVPEKSTLLIGDGRYVLNGRYYMNTDLGFMRLVLYGGCAFVIYVYWIVLSMLLNIRKRSGGNGGFAGYLFVVFMLFEMKGEATITLIPFLLICVILLYIQNQHRIN